MITPEREIDGITVAAAAERLGISKRVVTLAIERGEIEILSSKGQGRQTRYLIDAKSLKNYRRKQFHRAAK